MPTTFEQLSDRLYTADECAHFLGLRSRRAIYDLIDRGELAHFRIGARIRISKQQLEELLQERRFGE